MAVAMLVLPLALILLRCSMSPSVPFISPGDNAPWVMAPTPVTAALQQWGKAEATRTRYLNSFQVPEAGAASDVSFKVRSLGSLTIRLNGHELSLPTESFGPSSGERTVHTGSALQAGENRLLVEVANRHGPGLFALRSVGLADPVTSGGDWSVEHDGTLYAAAIPADDTRVNPLSMAVETPADAVANNWQVLLGLFAASVWAFYLLPHWIERRMPRLLTVGFFVGTPAVWLWIYLARSSRIPLSVGFDARHHLKYLRILVDEGRLPQAAEGWSTYHPPLAYALAALFETVGGENAVKLVPFLSGLGIVVTSWWLVRRLFPAEPVYALLAGLFAAVLPVNVYTAAYFSNEALHAVLAGAALLAAVELLLADGLAWRKLVIAAVVFGLAALSKFTVLVTVPVVLFFLAWKLVFVERIAIGRTAGALGAFTGIFLAVAGWFYLRSWLEYGVPVLGNWALPGEGQVWWQQPGFHTPAYFLGFGEALVHPYLAGFHSFWDSVYSTFWGDGFIGGRGDPTQRHEFWSYGFMSAGYWLAVPATVLMLGGAVRLAMQILGDGPPRQRLALAFLATSCWAVMLTFTALTLDLPYFAQAKAAYLLMLAGPLSLVFALGFGEADAWLDARGWTPARALLHGWLGTFALTLLLSFAA
ncbi:MAG: glycosyltransferase family 39 protein [Myxococcales bacterium]|nr:glycosyltransferase family 39 protein [Myxococcales bacterium]